MTAAGPQGFAGYFAPKRHAQAIPPGSKKRHQGGQSKEQERDDLLKQSTARDVAHPPLLPLRTVACDLLI